MEIKLEVAGYSFIMDAENRGLPEVQMDSVSIQAKTPSAELTFAARIVMYPQAEGAQISQYVYANSIEEFAKLCQRTAFSILTTAVSEEIVGAREAAAEVVEYGHTHIEEITEGLSNYFLEG